jgi:hypothetical protein
MKEERTREHKKTANEMGRMCIMHEEMRKCYKILVRILEV